MEFSPEAELVHAGTERGTGDPLAPPLLITSTYVSQGEPDPERGYGRNANPGWAAVPAPSTPASASSTAAHPGVAFRP